MKTFRSTISDYIDALASPEGRFRTLTDIEPSIDAYDEVIFYAGNSAAVFPVVSARRRLMLKCYIKQPLNADRIYAYLSSRRDPLLTPCRLLSEELYVHDVFEEGGYHDILAADMVEGITLETAIRRAVREEGRQGVARLSSAFDGLAVELLRREWAHGDLKPENIIVRPDGTMCLIDYDAMFIPALTGRETDEVGTPQYQHPLRDVAFFCKAIDDYPAALIAVSLRALALDTTLYDRWNRGDNIILYPEQVTAGCSAAFDEVLQLFTDHGHHRSYGLALKLRSPGPAIPGLAEMLEAYPALQSPVRVAADVTGEYGVSHRRLSMFDEGGLTGYRDEQGRVVFPAIYERATEFSDGVAAVRLHGEWKILSDDGAMRTPGKDIDEMRPFSEGMAAVSCRGVWGYVDRDGHIVAEPRFEMAGSMRGGRALVRIGGRYGFIGADGRMAIEARFDYATGFRDGVATVSESDRLFAIDRDGRETDE